MCLGIQLCTHHSLCVFFIFFKKSNLLYPTVGRQARMQAGKHAERRQARMQAGKHACRQATQPSLHLLTISLILFNLWFARMDLWHVNTFRKVLSLLSSLHPAYCTSLSICSIFHYFLYGVHDGGCRINFGLNRLRCILCVYSSFEVHI